jgi:hypothetical protein
MRDTIDMAREAGWPDSLVAPVIMTKLAEFAALVRADEREACAKLADEQLMNTSALMSMPPKSSAAWSIATAIRARNER